MTTTRFSRTLRIALATWIAACATTSTYAAEELTPKFVVLPSLAREVTIDLDRVEIPTIHATSIEDLVRAQGWIHARERFLQMDLARREAAGELWQLVPQAKARDLMTLPMQLRSAARHALANLPADQRALLEQYAEGVNAFLATTTPFEYSMLKLKPTPWKAEDSLLIQLGMARYLDSSPEFDRAKTPLLTAFPDIATFLASSSGVLDRSIDGSPLPPPPPIPDAATIDFRLLRATSQAPSTEATSETPTPHGSETHPGSNAFAVAGSRTKDGRAIVANDMHLMLTAPGIWYRVRLEWPQHELEGLSLPGVPLVIQGSNGLVAWAFTNLTADLSDLIVVERDPADPTRYLTSEGSKPFSTRSVRVGAGSAAEDVVLQSTDYGPIIETRSDGTLIALRWAPILNGLDCGLFALAGAQNLEEALAIARRWNGPPQNFLVADNGGRIGWTIAGALPDRAAQTARVVSWRDAPAWRGILDPDSKPTIVDPIDGILASANQLSLAPTGELQSLTGSTEAHGDRAYRIAELLRARRDWTESELHSVQLDVRSPRLLRWRDAMLALLATNTATEARGLPPLEDANSNLAIECLRAWDGNVTTDATAPVLLDAIRADVRRAFAEALASDAKRRGVSMDWWQLAGALDDESMLRIFESRPEHLLPKGESWTMFARSLVTAAATASLLPAEGDTPARFRTRGDVNRAAIRHPAADALGAAARLAEMPRTQLPGHPTTVRVQTPSFGASQRSVVSPGHEENAILVTPGGQSGLPTSPHFRSLHKSWQDGSSYPLRPTETTARVVLAPSTRESSTETSGTSAVNPSSR
ncbi:MAG: penicillin acylase [Planctomycetota bacterium]